MNKMRFVFSFVMLFPLLLTWGQEEARLMRFPTFFGDQVVFTYAGDLYTVPRSGGVARKITSDEGYEMFARFSPDGSQIAFTGQYDGNTEVYLIPATGGIPKRLTYTATLGRDDISDRMGPNNIVMTWKDNENIAFRSRKKSFNDFKGQLFLANVKGGIPQELPLPAGGFCSYSPDGAKLAYNQVFREFRTWKYYKGGMADDIRIYDFTSKTTENITNHDAQDIFPMWHGDNIYFCSDRDRTMNLFVYNLASKQTRKLTQFAEFDIKFPSLGNSGIIFENGGFLYIFDFRTEQITKLDIRIADDLITGRSEMKDASKSINSFTVSPDGKRVSFGARGDVWSVPVKSGITQNLTASPGVHNRNVAWSPDGKHIAYISDQTGEDELFMIQQDGLTEPVQITSGGDTYKYDIIWSPDSKKILWSDKKLRLLFVDIQSKEVTQVEQAADWEIRDYSWSPDSKWIAYAKPDRSAMTRLFLYSLATKSSTPVTDGWYDCGNPSFTDDGKYLFFASIRDFNPTYSWTEWNHAYQDMVKVYFLTLAKSTRNPLEPKNDEVAVEQESTEKETGKKEEKDKKEEPSKASKDLVVDMDGIIGRIVSLPIDPGAYRGINAIGEQVYYLRNAAKDEKTLLLLYDLKEKKETELGSVDNYEITADKRKMLVASSRKYAVIDLPKGKVDIKDFIDLGNMKMMVDVKAEWNQIYNEAWRQMKYFFYDANMHGVNWDNIREKYKPLLGYVSNRNDLNYILGEMVGELNVGHAYVGGGDKVEPRKIKMGLLGAEITRDASGFFRIDRILPGENWTSVARSPLTEVGVDVKEGDYIIAINRKPVKGVIDLYELLIGTAGNQVELTVNTQPQEAGARKVIVVPVDDESGLYYYNWVQNNMKKVSEASNGQIGYIHIPDMGPEGLNEFVKHFYPQLRKKALIIDDRGNGGGNVSSMIIERLRRELVFMEVARNTTTDHAGPALHYGPKAVLIDQYSASDGDLFPYQFKSLKLGKTIGVRTWGGVVGIRGSLPFIDGGSLMKPEFAHFDKEGKEFVIEGKGVEPDIRVVNDPAKEYAGEDQQLNKAIEVLLEELKNNPKQLPDAPPYPDKTR